MHGLTIAGEEYNECGPAPRSNNTNRTGKSGEVHTRARLRCSSRAARCRLQGDTEHPALLPSPLSDSVVGSSTGAQAALRCRKHPCSGNTIHTHPSGLPPAGNERRSLDHISVSVLGAASGARTCAGHHIWQHCSIPREVGQPTTAARKQEVGIYRLKVVKNGYQRTRIQSAS